MGACAGTTLPREDYVYLGGRRIGVIASSASYTGSGCTGTMTTSVTLEGAYLSDKMDMPHYVWDVAHKKEAWAADFSSFGEPLVPSTRTPPARARM